ncbi:MerC domain-containing protein [Candidatus Obscuribacterales bacterium]|nr:MerC domain-containing protein [Candidatus Obscuribacterales bacterium]
MLENKPTQHQNCCGEDHSPAEAGKAQAAEAIVNTNVLNTAVVMDNLGIIASAICLVHCLAMPFVIALLPVLGLQFLESHESHMYLAAAIWAFALFAIVPGYLKHRKLPILLGTIAGLGLVTLGVMYGHALLGERGEMICLSAGNLMLVAVHWKNRGLCKCGTDH